MSRVRGSILGLALGDAFGAAHEGGILERALWRLIGRTGGRRRFTDDTQMTLDVIESIVDRGRVDQDDLAARFAKSYRWSRGYGKGMARTLRLIRRGWFWQEASTAVFAGGSYGNGGAMRAPAVGLFMHGASVSEIASAANDSAAVTHAHPEGRDGAKIIALAVALAFNDADDDEILETIAIGVESRAHVAMIGKASEMARAGFAEPPETVALSLGNGVRASESCTTAVYSALAFRRKPFEGLLSFTIGIGGDTDTISGMAGAIWGAANGCEGLPSQMLDDLEQRDRIEALAFALAGSAESRK